MTDQTTTTERMLNEDINGLYRSVEKACAQIDRLQAEKAELLAACKYTIAVEAKWRRENGEPLRTLECQRSYDMVIAAIAKCEATS